MNRWFWTLITGGCIALASMSVACGDDDDSPVGPGDGGGGDTGQTDGETPDGGCTFASYTIGLITNSTTNTAVPDTTLGANCAETTSQDAFKSLFP